MKHIIILFLLSLLTQSQAQELEKLPDIINTKKYDEVAPVLSGDGGTLYFSRLGYPQMVKTLIHDGQDISKMLSESDYKERIADIYSQLAGHRVSYPFYSVYNQDIWIAKQEKGEWSSVSLPPYPLNSALPNTVLTYWDEADELILLNQFFADGSMNEGLSRISVNETRKLPQPLHIYDFYTYSSDVQASISSSGDVLILALERDDSIGDMDLYISFRSGKEIWSAPRNLGDSLNSKYRESTPFLSKDGKYLFFASNRPGGAGGLDIYMSQRMGNWQSWTSPSPLGHPVNSASDDSQPCFSPLHDYLYFTSMRDGSSDIYRIPLQLPSTGADSVLFSAVIPDYKVDQLKENELLVESYIMSDILFKPQKAELTKGSLPALRQLSNMMTDNPEIKIIVEGHTDSGIGSHSATGDPVKRKKELLLLSRQRANTIKEYLVSQGISEVRIRTVGYGDQYPLNDNSNEMKRRLNRRVEIVVVK